MGTGRGEKAHSSDVGKKKAHHREVTAPNGGGPGQTSHLLKIAPKAGMIYPFRKSLMKHSRPDVFLFGALTRALAVPLLGHLTTQQLDDVFAQIFEEATDLLKHKKDEMTTIRAYHSSHRSESGLPLLGPIRARTACLRNSSWHCAPLAETGMRNPKSPSSLRVIAKWPAPSTTSTPSIL